MIVAKSARVWPQTAPSLSCLKNSLSFKHENESMLMITDDTCLVIMSDASDIGVGSALWRVKRVDANKVTIEDLQDHTVSTIIATDAKVLSQSEQNWFTFEQEIIM